MTEQPRPDADDWQPHDGSPKRPKGVGNRDKVKCKNAVGEVWGAPASMINWAVVDSYCLLRRAPKKEKRRKVWAVAGDNDFLKFYRTEKLARLVCGEMPSGILYTAKLKEVKE